MSCLWTVLFSVFVLVSLFWLLRAIVSAVVASLLTALILAAWE